MDDKDKKRIEEDIRSKESLIRANENSSDPSMKRQVEGWKQEVRGLKSRLTF